LFNFAPKLELDDGNATGCGPRQVTRDSTGHRARVDKMSEVFDDIIDRETDVARIAAIVASDFRFAIFGTAAFAVRLLRLY
jgi:hypothetical protein